jgi:hypothetical protein
MTALHYMLRNNSDTKHIATAIDILRRKRDPALRKLAELLAGRA